MYRVDLDIHLGILGRHESLAANLGAKLTAPRLLKAMEGAFDNPIKTIPTKDTLIGSPPPTWLDIVKFSKSNPTEFVLTTNAESLRICQIYLKGYQVEIAEDDWRLIISGVMDRFITVIPDPSEEDEMAELATIEILEVRLQWLIKKADDVARCARKINYQVRGRKAAIAGRMANQQSAAGFQPVNIPSRSGPSPGYDLKADLLQQFESQIPSTQRFAGRGPLVSVPATPTQSVSNTPSMKNISAPQVKSRPSPAYSGEPQQITVDDPSTLHRPLITARIEKLARGEPIYPPCDRCRRLKVQCIKHLTACQGCTKKHAKCGWKGITGEELAWITGQSAGAQSQIISMPNTGSSGSGGAGVKNEIDIDLRASDTSGVGEQQDPTRNDPPNPRTSDIGNLLRQDDDDGGTGRARNIDSNPALPGQIPVPNQSVLTNMASAASAEAEARAAVTHPQGMH